MTTLILTSFKVLVKLLSCSLSLFFYCSISDPVVAQKNAFTTPSTTATDCSSPSLGLRFFVFVPFAQRVFVSHLLPLSFSKHSQISDLLLVFLIVVGAFDPSLMSLYGNLGFLLLFCCFCYFFAVFLLLDDTFLVLRLSFLRRSAASCFFFSAASAEATFCRSLLHTLGLPCPRSFDGGVTAAPRKSRPSTMPLLYIGSPVVSAFETQLQYPAECCPT